MPEEIKAQGKRTLRSIHIEGQELEFSDGFTDLHTISYDAILQEKGFRIGENRTAIEIVHDIGHAYAYRFKRGIIPLQNCLLRNFHFVKFYF
jgi:UDP-N-acetyl-2-amino-2-deoxyglucuronate dehydrogenase